MALPSVTVTKVDGKTGVVKPAATGTLAIIAPASSGSLNLASSFYGSQAARAAFPYGILPEVADYVLGRTGKPVVLVRCVATTTGAMGTINVAGVTGTSVVTATVGAQPVDDFTGVKILIVNGGTRGTTGITYKYALDGVSYSAVQALGVATVIAIPNTGISVDLSTGTLIAGDFVTFDTTGPRMTSADLTAALEALRVSTLPFESVLIATPVDATIFDAAEAWRVARDLEGRLYTFVENTALKGAASEATYASTLSTTWSAKSGPGTVLCADGFSTPSGITGIVQTRPTAWDVAAAGMAVSLGTDVAAVSLGARTGVTISDASGNPKFHNEALYPGLDDNRFTTMRTFIGDGAPEGVYITNAKLFSSTGSDYVFWQHMRTINRGCAIAKQRLTFRLSQGVQTQTVKLSGVDTVVIAEVDAREIEDDITSAVLRDLRTEIQDSAFTLSRTDDLSSNAGATLNGDLSVVAKRYVKQINATAHFSKSITATV